MLLPPEKNFTSAKLAGLFNKKSSTYKFYWFISILEIISKKQQKQILFEEILTRMIANAWYPIHYFKLSFGQQDQMSESIKSIQRITNLPIDADKDKIQQTLLSSNNKEVWKIINNFSLQVPYRFLSTWFKFSTNKKVIAKSNIYYEDCLYSIVENPKKAIVLNDKWWGYLIENQKILIDFCYWNLTMYLQTKNPNVPDIPNKLVKPIVRNGLSSQRAYWDIVFDQQHEIECIYSGKKLTKAAYDLEHFIPWSFVAHDLQWNLLPSDKSINISKSNKLPPLDLYLTKFVETQKSGLEIVFKAQPHNKKLEEFTMFGYSAYDLMLMPLYNFNELYYKTMSPMVQIAENMGFEKWNRTL